MEGAENSRITPEEEQAILAEIEQEEAASKGVGANLDDEAAAAEQPGATESGEDAGDKSKGGEGGEGGEGGASSHDQDAVIKTRDGKHEIPYSVLEAERRRARELQQQLEEANRKLQSASEKAQAGGEAAGNVDPGTSVVDLDLKVVADEYGEDSDIYKMAVSQKALAKKLAEQDEYISKMRSQEEAAVEAQQNEARLKVDEAIDSVPMLREWRDDPTKEALWADAVAMDSKLRNNPQYANKPLTERFEKVVELVAQINGLPFTLKQEAEAPSGKKPDQKEDDDFPLPNSLSEIDGGMAVDQSMMERVERMSVVELESMMEKMTPDQREAFLAQL